MNTSAYGRTASIEIASRPLAAHSTSKPRLVQHRLDHALVDDVVLDDQDRALARRARGADAAAGSGSVRGASPSASATVSSSRSPPDRLLQVVVDAGLARRGTAVGRGREHDQPRAAQRRRERIALRELDPVHPRHLAVEHDELERLAGARRVVHRVSASGPEAAVTQCTSRALR